MRRLRRLGLLSLVITVGTVPLGACRSAPTVAAYVGDQQYSQSLVDDMVSEIEDAVNVDPEGQRGAIDYGVVRQLALGTVIMGDIARRAADTRGLTIPAADLSTVVSMLNLTEGTELTDRILASTLAEELAETEAVMTALHNSVTPVEPSLDDQLEVYSTLTSAGQKMSDPFEDIQPFFDAETIGDEVALRALLEEEIEETDLTVNPRYAPLTWQVAVRFNEFVSGTLSIDLATR